MTDQRVSGHDGEGTDGAHGAHAAGEPGALGTAEFWEDFYRDSGPWTGNPNVALVTELAERPLGAGSALDLACGTGGDAIWLASEGWAVTGVDISHAALEQAATAADAAGLGERIRWQQADLETGFPEGAWDLVNVAYLHSPVALTRERILHSAAGAVAPGGTLIIVGHQGPVHWASESGGQSREFPSVDETLAAFDLAGWTLVHSGDVTVTRQTPDGTSSTHVDSIVRLRREAV